MKTLVSKDALNRMALCVCFLSALTNGLFAQKPLPIAQGAEPITITMTADHWQTEENAEFVRQLGFYHGLMRLNSRLLLDLRVPARFLGKRSDLTRGVGMVECQLRIY